MSFVTYNMRMKKTHYLLLTILIIPFTASAQGLQASLTNVVNFLDKVIIPFLLAIGFLFFVINVIRYFVIEGHDEDGREKAKALAIYSVSAFVLIVIFWGLVNLFADSTNLNGCNQPMFDYQEYNFIGPPLPAGC